MHKDNILISKEVLEKLHDYTDTAHRLSEELYAGRVENENGTVTVNRDVLIDLMQRLQITLMLGEELPFAFSAIE